MAAEQTPAHATIATEMEGSENRSPGSSEQEKDPEAVADEVSLRKSKWAPLTIVGGFLLSMNTQGMIASYGVYQTYYSISLPNESHSKVAWIGSLQGFLLLVGGFLYGPLFDAGYLRSLLIIGTLLQCVGLFMVIVPKVLGMKPD